jgi:hypothetical protein
MTDDEVKELIALGNRQLELEIENQCSGDSRPYVNKRIHQYLTNLPEFINKMPDKTRFKVTLEGDKLIILEDENSLEFILKVKANDEFFYATMPGNGLNNLDNAYLGMIIPCYKSSHTYKGKYLITLTLY